MLTPVAADIDIARLNNLISTLEKSGTGELLVEHLQTACAYLHGGMPEECVHNLGMVQSAADALPDKSLAKEVKETVADLLQGIRTAGARRPRLVSRVAGPSPGEPATARQLKTFFHGEDVHLGIFYPKQHVVAVFRSFAEASTAAEALYAAGLPGSDAIAVPGEEVQLFLEHLRSNHALWSSLMTELSRILDTEASLVDAYNWWAERGAGFVIACAPTQEAAERVYELLKPESPEAVHWFMTGYIRHLM